jgi:hypothetical protein
MLPAWATITISLGAALITALAAIGGAWLHGSLENREQWRDRLVKAADDFATSVLQALLALRDAQGVVHDAQTTQDLKVDPSNVESILDLREVAESIKELDRRVDEAHARLARVQLLFGLKSKAGKAAADCVLTLRGGAGALREWPYPEWERAGNLLATTHDLHEAFLTAALEAVSEARG